MPVDEQDVGLLRDVREDFANHREFTVGQVGRDVRKTNGNDPLVDLEDIEAFRIKEDRHRERTVSDVRGIDPSEDADLRGFVDLANLRCESTLFRAEVGEDGYACKMVNEPIRGNLLSRLSPKPRHDSTAVCAHDLPVRIEIGMLRDPLRDGSRRTDVTQRPRHHAAACDPTRRDSLDRDRECLFERDSHTRPIFFVPQNLSSARPIGGDRMTILLKDGLIVTQDRTRRVMQGDVFVDGARIAAVGQAPQQADEVIDCVGCAVLPGLINAHQHVANTLLRGVADDVPLEGMLAKSFAVDARLTRRDIQIGALLGCLEMIRSGTTSFQDLFYWEDEVARAVRESGMRGFLSWVTLDPESTTQHGDPVKNADAFVAKHLGDPLVTPSVGVQGVYVASEETLHRAAEVAVRRDVRLHMHLSETRKEVYDHVAKTGRRPAEWLESIGFLDPRLNVAHGVWLTLNEVRTLARHGVSVTHCPVSNMKLASGGTAPVPEMMDAGVRVALGTDSALSNNSADLFSEMKTASLLHKATRWDARILPAQTVLDFATVGAAEALGVGRQLGSLEVGKRADLAVVSLRQPHTTPFYLANVISHLVYCSRGSDVQATIVDGQVLMAGGVVRTVDEDAVLERAQETARELFEA